MSNFYTKKGDEGMTGTLGKLRLPKYHPRIEALGALDETSATLGLARALAQLPEIRQILLDVQKHITALMGEVAATTPQNAEKFRAITPQTIAWLETTIENLSEKVEIPRQFIFPGEKVGSGALSVARTVTRRAERRVAELFAEGELENGEILRYLNRLSSLIFILELAENQLTK